ncbi:MAG: FAD-dependent oxidoreductase [Acidobacteriota bacterium]|nr:FAD-dependent oxidoreductase [Acidobacteriota bacterium]MDH3783948.1 FAD-dependent oxidoreductase [Acidobacteriota bacterium]
MILIVGGGLAGMSTAYHLGETEHLVLEGAHDAGGLCRSRDIDGFIFDYTGHLLHMKDPRIMAWVEEMLPDTFAVIERDARIRSRGATLPFPFQGNLHGLPKETVADCLVGFVESLSVPLPDDPQVSFEDWSLAVFGRGISDAFMLPYNCKLFCRAPAEMTADWVSWAVPKPTLEELIRGAIGLQNRGMGYNSKFRYPHTGGIDVLPKAVASRVKNIRFDSQVTDVDLSERSVGLTNGERIGWDKLVVTCPLPHFLNMAHGGPQDYSKDAARLDWSVVACLNLGIDRSGLADGAHWLYFPDEDAPFYRVGFPSNFSDGVAPAGTSSMYIEFGLRRDQEFDEVAMGREALACLRREGILTEDDRVLVEDWVRVDPGYTIFDRDRQDVMQRVMPELEQQDIHCIGRYGAWTYSYMERALLDGLELAEKIG